jgi:BirA family biotin operon repressor/biotin-[acetyl-CoA-carboxylase] ligase
MIQGCRDRKPIIGHRIILLDRVESTNSFLKEAALQGAEEGMVVIAREQLAGRGRSNRIWFSPPDSGLYLSVLMRPALAGEHSGALSLMLALAVIRAIRRCANVRATVKWPNDLMIAGRKVCGILVENHLNGGVLSFAVAGIGININQTIADFPLGLRIGSTSLYLAAGRQIDKDEFVEYFLKQINLLYPHLNDMKMRQKWVDLWQRHCHHLNQLVAITRGTERREGIFQGITSTGAALIELENSSTVQFESGEFTLREKS